MTFPYYSLLRLRAWNLRNKLYIIKPNKGYYRDSSLDIKFTYKSFGVL